MATLEDVRRIALALPGAVEAASYDGAAAWKVGRGLFVWERPMRAADLDALADAAPAGAVLGVRVADEGVKEALLADDPEVFFTTPHFDGYPAVLVRLEAVAVADLEELVVEAWLDRAPKKAVRAWQEEREGAPG